MRCKDHTRGRHSIAFGFPHEIVPGGGIRLCKPKYTVFRFFENCHPGCKCRRQNFEIIIETAEDKCVVAQSAIAAGQLCCNLPLRMAWHVAMRQPCDLFCKKALLLVGYD